MMVWLIYSDVSLNWFKKHRDEKVRFHAAKNAQVATTLLTSCNRSVTTSGYQNTFTWHNSGQIVQVGYQYMLSTGLLKLFQQLVASLQMTKCNNPDFTRPTATWWNWQVSLLQLVEKLQQAGTSNNCGVFCCVRKTCHSTAETLIFVIMKKKRYSYTRSQAQWQAKYGLFFYDTSSALSLYIFISSSQLVLNDFLNCKYYNY